MNTRRQSSPDTSTSKVESSESERSGIGISSWVPITNKSRLKTPTDVEDFACSPHESSGFYMPRVTSDSTLSSRWIEGDASISSAFKPLDTFSKQMEGHQGSRGLTSLIASNKIDLPNYLPQEAGGGDRSVSTSGEGSPEGSPTGSPDIPRRRFMNYVGRASYSGYTDNTDHNGRSRFSDNSKKWFQAGFGFVAAGGSKTTASKPKESGSGPSVSNFDINAVGPTSW